MLVFEVLLSAAALPACSITIDKVLVRAGDDITCFNGTASIDACAHACCGHSSCLSFSYNAPWTLKDPYMGCIEGSPCCCLKSAVPPLEDNKWKMNITTGTVTVPPKACKSAMDCNLNGDCLPSGECKCDASWTDHDCGTLNLVPVASLDGAYQHKVNLKDCDVSCGPSSWGGLPLKGVDNKYHLFASQFVNNCTLAGWNRGSTVVRAVADDPFGPYTFAETVLPTFHHNPTVRRLSPQQAGMERELFVMYMIGDDVPPPEDVGAKCQSSDYHNHHLEGYIAMAQAFDLLGPWNVTQHAILTSGDMNAWDAMVTNPAPFFADDGAAYLYYRGTQWPTNGYERIGLAKATSWRGPYGRLSDKPLWGGNGTATDDQRTFVEDPFVWQDARGMHLLSHGHFDENGYYACAPKPEGPWQFRIKPAYTNAVAMQDGSTQILVQRERPQIWFDEDTGKPSILFTGVAPPGSKFYGYTYTFAQRIKQEHT